MTCPTGDHGARITAAKAEPSPITALRDMLATAFAADIAAVTPMVCEVMRDELLDLATHSDRAAVKSGAAILERNCGALPVEVAQTFRIQFDAKLLSRPASRAGKPLSGLSLMDEGQLQYELALDQCTARLKEQASAEMFHLTARVAAMLDKPALDDHDNPVAPRMFVATLASSLRAIGLGDAERFAVFKAFRPPLLYIAPDLYNHANGLLEELGVAAEFKVASARPAVAARPTPAILADEAALGVLLDRLLNGRRALGHGGAAHFAVAM